MRLLCRSVNPNSRCIQSLSLLVVSIAFAAQVGFADDLPVSAPATLCDVLNHLDRYRGRTITVIGIYYSGALQQRCPGSLLIGGHTYGWALDVATSGFATRGEHFSIPFETDLGSYFRLDKLTLKEAQAKRKEAIWVTIRGMIFGVSVGSDGRARGGFGHLNALPAEIVVDRVLSVSIKPKPAWDYGKTLRNGTSFAR